jgi:hypothetical protein
VWLASIPGRWQLISDALFAIITAVGRAEYDLIEAAVASFVELQCARRRGRQGVEWIVALDGPEVGVSSEGDEGVAPHRARLKTIAMTAGVPVDIVVNRAPGGSALARNVALTRVSAPWLLTLDSDDVLVADGVLAMLEAVESVPGAAWAAGRCPHMDRDGVEIWAGPDDPFLPGPVERGAFWEAKLRLGGLPFVCAATLASTKAVRQAGGWPSRPRPRGADTALWAVMTSQHRGVWVPRVVYHYRRHPASVTMQPGFREQDERLEEIVDMIRAGTTQIPN